MGQLDVTPHFQVVDGRQVAQAVVVFKQVLTVHSHLEAVAFTHDPHREALASKEGHFSGQAPLLRPPRAADLRVSDHSILIETGVQVEGDVTPRAQVDVEPASIGQDGARYDYGLGGVQPTRDGGKERHRLSGGEGHVSQRLPEQPPLEGELSTNFHEFGLPTEFDNHACEYPIFKKELHDIFTWLVNI